MVVGKTNGERMMNSEEVLCLSQKYDLMSIWAVDI